VTRVCWLNGSIRALVRARGGPEDNRKPPGV
jgi:hypothetical protein